MDAIHIDSLVKNYGRFTALKGINLRVQQGEIFGFLGPNGAGKSTTIRILMDEIRASAGSAQIFGLDAHRQSVSAHARIGYLPSDLALYPKMTGKQTLEFFAKLRGGADWHYVEQLRERFDAQLDKRVGELSSGNRQKVGLISAFMSRPDLLIMDEPNSGLDPLVQHQFHSLLKEVAAEGHTVFLSSHTLSEVQRVADRVGIIRQGEMVAVQSVEEMRVIRSITLVMDRDVDGEQVAMIPGVTGVTVTGNVVKLNYPGEVGQFLSSLPDRYRIVDLSVGEADLEDLFLTYYQDAL